jgi:hypothetical protein
VIGHLHVYHRVKGKVTNEWVLMIPQLGHTVDRSGFGRAGKEVCLRSGTDNIFEGKLVALVGSGQVKLQYFGLWRPLVLAAGVSPWKTKTSFQPFYCCNIWPSLGSCDMNHPWRMTTDNQSCCDRRNEM